MMPASDFQPLTIRSDAVELSRYLEICDQTIGCERCGRAWWGEHFTERVEDFHADDCPLKGRRDAIEVFGWADEEEAE